MAVSHVNPDIEETVWDSLAITLQFLIITLQFVIISLQIPYYYLTIPYYYLTNTSFISIIRAIIQ